MNTDGLPRKNAPKIIKDKIGNITQENLLVLEEIT